MTLVTSQEAVAFLSRTGYPVSQATLRQWAHRGRLDIHGKRGSLNLYDLDAVMRLVKLRDAYLRDSLGVKV